MLFAVFFLFGRRYQVIFGIVVNHGFCENFVIVMALGVLQLGIHEGCDLVHIKADIRNVFRFYIVYLF